MTVKLIKLLAIILLIAQIGNAQDTSESGNKNPEIEISPKEIEGSVGGDQDTPPVDVVTTKVKHDTETEMHHGNGGKKAEAQEEATPGVVESSSEPPIPTRCYGKWGCMTFGDPFLSVLRPVNLFPFHPDILKVHFLLMTRKNTEQFLKLKRSDETSFSSSPFDPSKPVTFIVHGYLEHGNQKWIKDMIQELLTKDNYNVISVDWVFGAAPPYTQAVANARMVGVVLADFINYLQSNYSVKAENIHIIGHSLGAHVAGYAGEKIEGLGRITGLDPAEPYFQYTDPKVRLDPTDASFVDVIHTDGGSLLRGGLGMIQDCGNVDFYPNGGVRQPGCDNGVIGSIEKEGIFHGIRRYIGCNHLRAYELFTASINTECPFYGFVCDSYRNFTEGLCTEGCGPDNKLCAPTGFRADTWKSFAGPESVKMFLQTGNAQPFCQYHYVINVKYAKTASANKRSGEKGRLFVHFSGSRRQSQVFEAKRHVIHFEAGGETNFLVSDIDLGRLLRLDIQWTSHAGHFFNPLTWRIFDPPAIYINEVSVTTLETGVVTKFCGRNEPQAPERIRVLFADSEGDICPDESQEPEVESATPATGGTRSTAPQSDDEP